MTGSRCQVAADNQIDIRIQKDWAEYSCEDVLSYVLLEVTPSFTAGSATDAKTPVDIVFVLDVSGSMDNPSKYPLMLEALRTMVRDLAPEDRLSIIIFSTTSEVICGLLDGPTLRETEGKLISAMDHSPCKFGGWTNMASAIARAYEVLSTSARPNAVRRVYCLTDGELHDAAACRRMMARARGNVDDVHIYGFGRDFNVEQLVELVADAPGGTVKPLVETQAVVWTFHHLAKTASNVVARNLRLDVSFVDDVICGDLFEYRPREVHLGPIADVGPIYIGSAERGRSYSFVFEVRLPEVHGPSLSKIGTVTLEYLVGANLKPMRLSAAIELDRSRVTKWENGRVATVRDLVLGLRETDQKAQLARCEARLALYRAENRDPALLAALERELQQLRNPEGTPVTTAEDRLYLESTPRSVGSGPASDPEPVAPVERPVAPVKRPVDLSFFAEQSARRDGSEPDLTKTSSSAAPNPASRRHRSSPPQAAPRPQLEVAPMSEEEILDELEKELARGEDYLT